MPLPRGSDPDKAIFGYMQALQGFPVEAIAHGIRRFLRGECSGVNPKFCPHPPELATIIRDTIGDKPKFRPEGRIYGYRPPESKIIERRLTKDRARQLVKQGVHPLGSIWCPGPLTKGDGDPGKPEIGDLYAPDPEWRGAFALGSEAACP